MKDKKLNYDEMLERVPDYIFERLHKDELVEFEMNLPNFPEIQKEIFDAKQVFEKFDNISFDKLIEDKTRNLSVGINSRLSKSNNLNRSFMFRFAIPMIALSFLLIFIFTNEQKNGIKTPNNVNNNSNSFIKLNQNDAISLLDDKVSEDDLLKANSHMVSLSNYPDDLANLASFDEYKLNDLILDEIFNRYSVNELESVNTNATTNDIMDLVKDLDENDLQIILKGIEDAKIIS